MLRTTVAAVATLALSTFALVGCPGPNPSNYCDSTGCYECDGYGCHPANPTVDGGADGGTCTSKADCTPGNDCVGGSCKPAIVCSLPFPKRVNISPASIPRRRRNWRNNC